MGYASTTGVIIYWKPDQPFVIHRSHNVWFDECNSLLSIEYKHNPGYLLILQDPEFYIHNLYFLNLIPCNIDLKCTSFCDTKIPTYEIDLPSSGERVGFNLLHDECFTI